MMSEGDKYMGVKKRLPRQTGEDASPSQGDFGSLPETRGEDEEDSPAVTNISQKPPFRMSLKEQYDALRDRDTTFVFLFGPPASGKTAITSTLAYHMGTDEEGELKTRSETDIRAKGMVQDIFKRVRQGTFLERSYQGTVYEIDLVYTPLSKKLPMNFTFLEMSGEDLKEIEIKPNSTTQAELIPQIDVFLGAPDLSIIFVLVVDYKEASAWDGLMVAFMNYIGERRKAHAMPKMILLVSKWDEYAGRFKKNNDLKAFVKENMPFTFGRLNAMNAVIDFYTVGEVQQGEIVKFNPVRAAAIKRWLYHAITGYRLPGNTSWWERFLAFLGL